MSKKIIAQNEEIVIGADVSDKAHHIAVSLNGEIVREKAMRLPTKEMWSEFVRTRLPGCKVKVVYEAGPQGYTLHDLIRALGHEAVVIAPVKNPGVKTNRRDARMIVHDYLAGRSRVVCVPSFEKRVARQALRLRNMLMKETKRTMNRINGIMRTFGISGTMGTVHKDDTGLLAHCLGQLDAVLDSLRCKIKETERALDDIARSEPFRDQVEKLTKITGIGTLSALEVVLGVADIGAFRNSAAFASYTGLCPGEWSTGETRRVGHITRRGPGRLRGVLVQCAWARVRYDAGEKERYMALKQRKGSKKAIVAIARRLAVRVWHTLNSLDPVAA
jgi:transposase